MADAVQPDLSGGLLRLQRGRQRRGGGALHPRVVDDVLEGRAVGRPLGQTPLDQMLALWWGEKAD